MTEESVSELGAYIETIESGYEFLLAYAAQGRQSDKGSGQGQDVREFLKAMDEALDGFAGACRSAAAKLDGNEISYATFLDAVDKDASIAQGVIRLVLTREDISSQLVDNLNANVHLRTLLTNLFVIDDTLNV